MASERSRRSTLRATHKTAKKRSRRAAAVTKRAARKPGKRRVARNTAGAAPQRPARVPAPLESLSHEQRRRLADKLIRKPAPTPPEPVIESLKALEPPLKRFHGMKVPILWFPGVLLRSPCADKFGYMFPASVRNASKLPFNAAIQGLLVVSEI
jgi:hypothetical protein